MNREIVFETERLLVGRWDPDDAESALRIYGNPAVVQHLNGRPDADLDAVRKRIDFLIQRNTRFRQGQGSFPVFEKESERLVGNAMLKPLPFNDQDLSDDVEIGWHLCESVWGKGYATEFGHKLLELGFGSLGLDPIHAVVGLNNQASRNVCERLGMNYVGITDKYYNAESVHHYILKATEFAGRHENNVDGK